jgi:hypothetical protein
MVRRFFKDDGFDFDTRIALGWAVSGGADVGEVFAAVDAIKDGDPTSWFTTWVATGRRLHRIAETSLATGHPVSARSAYLRASNYLALALNGADGLADRSAFAPIFAEHRSCWEAYTDLLDPPVERIAIAHQDHALPGWFFRPAGRVRPRPTLVLTNGSDGPVSSLWATGGAGALDRGYNVVMYDGPGQQAMLIDDGVPFRPDWEAVLTPLVDVLLTRADVDADRLVLYGISQGGYWVPRSLAFEHRFTAAVADPGVFDVSTAFLGKLPGGMRSQLARGDRAGFERSMKLVRLMPKSRRELQFRGRPYQQDSYYDLFRETERYRLDDVVDKIRTPLLVCDPDGEQFWPGQAQRLVDALPDYAELLPFRAAEGADLHGEPMARALVDQRMFDWVDDVFAMTGHRALQLV